MLELLSQPAALQLLFTRYGIAHLTKNKRAHPPQIFLLHCSGRGWGGLTR